MKFYNSLGPNPRLVRMFMLEKGIEMPFEEVDIMTGENRQDAYLARNPYGEMPCLELDDGSVIAETLAICEYLDELNSEPALVGASAAERANTRMWLRRLELTITGPMTDAFRSGAGKAMFEGRRHQVPQAVDDWTEIAQEGMARLEANLGDREFIAGDSLSLADIFGYCLMDFGGGVGQPIGAKNTKLQAWFERMAARPSAEASLHPVAAAGGMRA